MGKRKKKRFKKQKKQYQKAHKVNPYRSVKDRLKSINKNKNQIVKSFNKGKIKDAYQWLAYLRENQARRPDLLCKSLCDVAERIFDTEVQLELLEEASTLNPLDVVALTSYGSALANAGRYKDAFMQFERSLEVKPDDDVTLNSYGTALANAGRYEEAFVQFERSLELKPDETIALSSYGSVLANAGRYEDAFIQFERSLQLNPDNTIALSSYGNALASAGRYEEAFIQFERSLEVEPDDDVTLNSYGSALANAGYLEQAGQLFERSLQVKPDDTVALNSYGSALANAGYLEQACQLFERSLLVKPDNPITLTSYGSALTNAGRFEQAHQLFERSLQVKADDHITLFLYAVMLEKAGDYEEALSKMEEIALDELPQSYANFLCLTLGRLYYLIKEKEKGYHYFELVIQNAPRDDLARLRTALNILVVEPYSQEAIDILQQITEESPHYKQAFRMLSLNLTPKAYFEMFKESVQDELKDTAMLNRSMYHKIKNEIGILKGLVYEILDTDESQEPIFAPIIEGIEYIFDEIGRRRKVEEADLTQIPHDDYKKMLQLISQTAHDIADFVNNEVAIIKHEVIFSLDDLKETDPFYEALTELLEQLELTLSALNDLKSLNEGINIHYGSFKVLDLFEAWHNKQTFQHATIKLNIQNGEAEFEGDKAKIRSFVNELVDNAVKHNAHQADLTIQITSQDVEGLPQDVIGASRKQRRWMSEKKYLALIVNDNGQGIPPDKKNWIFVPLNTTSSDGSGLGLFIIQKTLAMMHGYILERGTQGASFELYIPYGGET